MAYLLTSRFSTALPYAVLVACLAALPVALPDGAMSLSISLPPLRALLEPRCALVAAGLAWSLYSLAFPAAELRSQRSHDPTSATYAAKRRAHFPPPFPNGWYRVCSSADLEGGSGSSGVHSISALGTDLVAFRDGAGRAAVLYAFCPHMGAHLGQGGTVVDGCLQCPFHEWRFDGRGACTHIPYATANEVPARAKTTAFETREHLGMVFVWFDAEGRPPAWELACHEEVAAGVAGGGWYFGTMRQMTFSQHVCEMHMNSADAYHFQTLHGPIPLPGLDRFVRCVHEVETRYFHPAPHLNHFCERMRDLTVGSGRWKFSVPFAAAVASSISTNVIFEGPAMMQFRIDTPLGSMHQIKTILPVGPFEQQVEVRWFAQRTVPRFLVHLMALVGATALQQDRRVWENKMYHKKPMLVGGDGPFPAFMRWYGQFYSESSEKVADGKGGAAEALDW
jgi:cholesterol 7-desaturase